MAKRIDELTATEAAALIRDRQLSAVEITEACLARIAERESVVQAWAHVDAERALAQAKARDNTKALGPLHGVPIGLKDIIDTVDLPTRYGSPIYAAYKPSRNAVCADQLTRSGAVILGKTVTTELANRFPGKARNPRNPLHTPGGSSSGSAAAVADRMVPLALGTQTTGSVIRPAAYCGVFGYKPSHGRFDLAGVLKLSPTLDTLGGMSRSVDDFALLASVLAPGWLGRIDRFAASPPRLAICRTPVWAHAEPATVGLLENIRASLSVIGAVSSPLHEERGYLDGLAEAQSTIMAVETAKSLDKDYREHRAQMSEYLRALIERGASCSDGDYRAALSLAGAARANLDAFFGAADALLTPSTAGEAPVGLDNTGEPVFNAIWTVLHVPCVTVPVAIGPKGLPMGIQVVGRVGSDTTVLAVAKWLAARFPLA